jgi:Flp pilus assembly protein TadG
MIGGKRGRVDRLRACLARLLRDRLGATLPMGAAAVMVMMMLIGSGVDMSRAYMTQTSLQSACDSGVLAGRRAMSRSNDYGTAEQAKANQMFAFNFPAASYGATGTTFATAANDDGEVTGTARAALPTVIMRVFGFRQFNLSVACSAELQLANADIVFVLDTTGSMNCNVGTSSCGDTEATNAKIKGLRAAVKDFHLTVARAVQNDDETRIRYAFVPYSMTVNVKNLILDGDLPTSYIANSASYQSRQAQFSTTPTYVGTSGNPTTVTETYSSNITQANCSTNTNNYTNNRWPTNIGPSVNSGGPAPAATTVTTYSAPSTPWTRVSGNGSNAVGTCRRNKTTTVTTYVTRYAWTGNWRYKPLVLDTTSYKSFSAVPLVTAITTSSTAYAPQPGFIDVQALARMSPTTGLTTTSYTWSGCIEERATVAQLSMDPVPAGATDLDINSAPESDATRWKPYFGGAEFKRGSTYSASLDSTTDLASVTEYCPSPMRKLQAVDTTDSTNVPAWLNTYLANLRAIGGTYHDIGMIWGGRLGSPRGIFEDTVNDQPERAVSRHIIFMTDDQMAPETEFYSAYGLELFDNRVAPRGTTRTGLIAYHNARFLAACQAAKDEGYTIWVIAFGTSVSTVLRSCSSAGRAYLSNNTTELQATFRFIASQVADLRLNR